MIVTPIGGQVQRVPGGMVYVDEMLREAQLEDAVDREGEEGDWLAQTLLMLKRRFGRQVYVRLVDQMSLAGLYMAIRYRLRHYPVIITPDGRKYYQPSPADLQQIVAALLQIPEDLS